MNLSTRREFLALAGCGSAAALLSPFAERSHAQDSTAAAGAMQFGLVTYLWGQDWDLPTLIANCETAGVHGVELRTEHAHGVQPTLTAKEREAVKARFADSSVTCLGPGTNQKFDDPDPAVLQENIEGAKAFVRLSHDIGGTGVKVKPDRLHLEVPQQQTLEQIGRSLESLGKFAADWGQEIRLEVHGQCAPLPLIAEILTYVEQPNVGICWNCNAQDLEGDGLEHNFRLVRDRFGRTVHIHPLDDGKYPHREFLDLLLETKYSGWLLLEASNKPEDRVAALRKQRELFEKMVGTGKS